MDIAFDLKQALETGNAVLFIGAGMGYNMLDEKGCPIPSGNELAKRIAKQFSVPVNNDNYDLARISKYVEILKSDRSELLAFVKSQLDGAQPDEYMKWIPTVKWKAIFTTNYDNCIQQAYDQSDKPIQEYVTITHITGFKDYVHGMQVPIIHLHGSFYEENSPEIIITQDDFQKYTTKRKFLFENLKQHMISSCILFTGYSHNDPNFQSVISDLTEELKPAKLNQSYRIDPFTDQMDKVILENRNIKTIEQTFSQFVDDARIQIEEEKNGVSYEKYENSIPSDFKQFLVEDTVATVRFFSTWQYVNQIGSLPLSNIKNYVRGDKPSWDVIFNQHYFRRNIEEEAFEELLDYATENKKRVRVCTITGSAGYGISTVLMSLAKNVAKEGLGKVFFHRAPKELREGDVFYAFNASENAKCFFFIDNAADYAKEINSLIRHASERKADIVFVLGDRQNELLSSSIRKIGSTFTIEPLSDGEIESLLDYLDSNNELNRLKTLDRDDQIAAIKVNYSRELLVAIREATEGKNFEAIILDEYMGIPNIFARKVYSVVACFHQHSAYLRVELLAKILNIDLAEFYRMIDNSLHGIVVFDALNESTGEYFARSRHRLISTIVWNRCLSSSDKDEIIHSSLDNINISYSVDHKAFQNFIRSDQFVDSLSSLESKMRFYERACKIDPDNPYVLQHYSRMLLRSKQGKAALNMIEDAIKMDKINKILHHTKGSILQHLAISADSLEIGRRYLGQSEDSYLFALRSNERDAYPYQGLSSLYLEWAKKCQDDQEQTLFLSKAEEIVNKGLEKAYDKEAMWIEASKIDRYIGDMPNQIISLKNAVSSAPHSPLSRYMLAKAYTINENLLDANELLKAIVHDHPDEYRVNMEYAKVSLLQGGSLQKSIAILQLSTLFGYSDPKFIAMLGGLLFLNKQFSESENIFLESRKRDMYNINKPMFDPKNCNIENIFNGTVKYVGNGHSYIYIDGLKDVRCLSSKYKGTILTYGMRVQVKLEFSPRMPLVYLNNN